MLVYLVIINAAGLLFMLADKQFARHHLWRIPESVLLLTAAAGGSAGCLLGMFLFRHKTRKPKFTVTVPLLFALHTVLYLYLFH